MLKDRVLFTLRFFDLQNTPLTLADLHIFLFNEPEVLRANLDGEFCVTKIGAKPGPVALEEIKKVLETDLASAVEFDHGFFCLKGRRELIRMRFENLSFRQRRERIIRRFLPWLKFVPFVRGAGLGGSHALGSSGKHSDIDLLIILDPHFFWLGRLLVTFYFQISGHRRHGDKIANRFCLNHYLAGPLVVLTERDPYNAMEYLRLKPAVFPQMIEEFVGKNLFWIREIFPNAAVRNAAKQKKPGLQTGLEKIFQNFAGRWLNRLLGQWQMRRITRGEPAVAKETELSFHSKSRKLEFLSRFFERR